jgi:hypothetical protein
MSRHKLLGITTIPIGDYDVLVEYEGHWENDGIGKYEYWGAICFDKGRDYLMVDEIKPLFTDETDEEIKEINSLLNQNFERYAEEISELHGENEEE